MTCAGDVSASNQVRFIIMQVVVRAMSTQTKTVGAMLKTVRIPTKTASGEKDCTIRVGSISVGRWKMLRLIKYSKMIK